jgi:hydroxyethylthiazole kinase
MERSDYADALRRVREKRPLVHHITNYVTVNDCANITLCVGGAPVMADAVEEVEEMVHLAGALVLNIGTLNSGQVGSMLMAGRMANKLSIPIVLDPVGAGATKLRTEVALKLLKELDISILKGNAGEIGVLAGTGGIVRGVDSMGVQGDPAKVSCELARSLDATVIMSGATDVISDGKRTFLVDNGHPLMGSISGTGCMAASVAGAFAAVNDDKVLAATAAMVSIGIAGEKAAKKAAGPGSFKVSLFDEMAALAPEEMARSAKVRKG